MDNSLNNSDLKILKDIEEEEKKNINFKIGDSIIEEFDNENNNSLLVNSLKEQNRKLRKENYNFVQKINNLKLNLNNQYKKELEDKNLELIKLKSIQMKYDSQFPLIKKAINNVREIINNLVPEDLYLRLKNISERDLSPSEWILIKSYEMIIPFAKENKSIKIENSNLRDEIKMKNDKINNILQELEHSQNMLKDKDSNYKRFNLNYENEKQNLEIELKRAYEEVNILNEKVLSYNKLNKDYKILLDEKEILENKIKLLSPYEKDEIPPKYQNDFDIKRKNEILLSEKELLTRENVKLAEKDRRNEEKIDKLEKDLDDSKKEIKKYIDKLLDAKNNEHYSYEKKINEDLQGFREKHNQEIETSKKKLTEIYEKQINYLNDNKNDLEFKINSYENQLKEKQNLLDNYIIDNKNLSNKFNNDYHDLRVDLKIKSNENEKYLIENTELKKEISDYNEENNKLKDQISLLKGEYYKLELNSKNDLIELRAELEVSKSTLKNYESMEKEIDGAIMNVDINNPFQLINNLNVLPTSKQKRIEQSVHLVKQLQKKQSELNIFIKENETLKNNMKEKEEELLMIQNLLEKAKLPSSYLVESLEVKEKEILELKQKLRNEIKEKNYLQANFKSLEENYKDSINNLENIKIKSDNIENMKQNLLNMIEKGKNNNFLDSNNFEDTVKNSNYLNEKPIRQNNKKPNWYNKLKYK